MTKQGDIGWWPEMTYQQAPIGYEDANSLDIPWPTEAQAISEAAFLNSSTPTRHYDVKAIGSAWYVVQTAWLNP